MSHIFISYSSEDRERASKLCNHLHSSGYDVWIDESEIDGAVSWSKEIAEAMEECSAFIVLLSSSSIASLNVAKELTAASELKKYILPVELEPVTLKREFLYHLSGVHRVGIDNIEGITRALEKIGVIKESNNIQSNKNRSSDIQYQKPETLIRLAVLPFEDLSPSHDNEWFADGMMDELIGTLGSLSKLIVPGRSSVMVYKKDRPKVSIIGQELEVRYIVEGTVRKAGEKIRISASLSDAKTNTQLWNNKFDGNFDDIFDFQERVAREITEGLKLKLTPQDEKKIELKITENPEAYELYQKANIYFNRQTKQDFLYALDCLNETVNLDPLFGVAYSLIARAHTALYRTYDRDDSHLSIANDAVDKAWQLNPDLPSIYQAFSDLYLDRGEKEKAIEAAKRMLDLDPKNYKSHNQLGFIYMELQLPEEAAKHYEEALRLYPTDLAAHYNLCLQYESLHDNLRRNRSAEFAFPYFQRHLKKNPDDQSMKMSYAILLEFLGRTEESLRIADELIIAPNADGAIIYNGACMIARLGDKKKALAAFQRAVKNGFYLDVNIFRTDSDFVGLLEMSEFEDFVKSLNSDSSD